jgi:hypothetical protein
MEKKSKKAQTKMGGCFNDDKKQDGSYNVNIWRIEAKVRDGCRRILIDEKAHLELYYYYYYYYYYIGSLHEKNERSYIQVAIM